MKAEVSWASDLESKGGVWLVFCCGNDKFSLFPFLICSVLHVLGLKFSGKKTRSKPSAKMYFF